MKNSMRKNKKLQQLEKNFFQNKVPIFFFFVLVVYHLFCAQPESQGPINRNKNN